MKLSGDDRRQLGHAIHEAGHAVIAVLSGGVIDRAEVLHGGPRTGPAAIHGYCRCDATFESGLRARDITAAGTLAQAVWQHGPAPTSRQIDAVLAANGHDRAKLRRMNLALGEPLTMPTDTVLPMVVRCWDPIADLAARMAKDGEIRHADVLRALSIPSHAQAAHHAALIRAGSTPGSFTATPAGV